MDPYLTIAEAGRRFRSGELTPTDLVEAQLERIAELNPRLVAFATVTPDAARQDAELATRELAARRDRGPLQGIPISFKDTIDTAGIRTTAGFRRFADRVPDRDATVVAKLREAGVVRLGKANTHELALGVQTDNPIFGQTRNPWDIQRIPGGSSGGSASAVAAGLSLGSIGTDSGGSVRIPASLTGIVGLRPTPGLVSTAGLLPSYRWYDTAGPLARTLEDAALLLGAMVGYDPDDFATMRAPAVDYLAGLREGVRGLRIGVPRRHFFRDLGPGIERAVLDAIETLRALGATVCDVEIAGIDDPWTPALSRPEIAHYHAAWLDERPEDYSPSIRRKILDGRKPTITEHFDARRDTQRLTETLRRVLETVDVLALPTTPITAVPVGGAPLDLEKAVDETELKLTSFVRPFSFLRVACLSVPCGFDPAGLPIGLQLVGRPNDEALLLRAGYAYEQEAGWYRRRPTL